MKKWMNEWMNERTFYLIFLHWVPPCRHEKNNITRLDIFNRASLPVIICLSFLPPCGKDMSRIWYSIVPYPGFSHATVQPLPPPPFFWAGPLSPYPLVLNFLLPYRTLPSTNHSEPEHTALCINHFPSTHRHRTVIFAPGPILCATLALYSY